MLLFSIKFIKKDEHNFSVFLFINLNFFLIFIVLGFFIVIFNFNNFSRI